MTERGERLSMKLPGVEEATKQHFASAPWWLKRKASKDKAPKQVKQHLRKSLEWLVTLESALRSATGHDLQEFVVPAQELRVPTDPWRWPLLLGSSDNGPDAPCASHFLLRELNCNVEMAWDTSHGAWGSARDALAKAGLSTHFFLMLMAFNCGYGEFKDCVRHQQIQQSMRDTIATSSPADDVIYQYCLPGIIADRKLDDRLLDHGLEARPVVESCGRRGWVLAASIPTCLFPNRDRCSLQPGMPRRFGPWLLMCVYSLRV